MLAENTFPETSLHIDAFLPFMILTGDAMTCLSFTAHSHSYFSRECCEREEKSSYVPFLPTFLLLVIQKLPFNAQKLGDILSSGTTLKTLFQNDIYYNKTALVPPDLNGEAHSRGTLWEVAKCVLVEENNSQDEGRRVGTGNDVIDCVVE